MILHRNRVALVCALPLLVGCASTERQDLVPLGDWTGRGIFVYEEWGPRQNDGAEESRPRTLHRSYPTHLSIRKAEAGDTKLIVLEILSQRGPLPDLGDATLLRLALTKAKDISDQAVLFYGIDAMINPSEPGELRLRAPEVGDEIVASCIRRGEDTVLRIQYQETFSDTYWFRGDAVEKEGAYYHQDGGIIHWVETLRPADGPIVVTLVAADAAIADEVEGAAGNDEGGSRGHIADDRRSPSSSAGRD